MRTLLFAAAVMSLVAAGQSLAQPGHGEHAVAPSAAADPDPALPSHEHCKAMMGTKMDHRAMHEHGAEKGAPMAGHMKPMSEAEMKKMQARCAARMAEPDKATKPPSPN